MIQNERGAGRKPKYKRGVETFKYNDLLPLPIESQIKLFIAEITKPYLNDEPVKSKSKWKK
jgi:hypothetical protein